MNATNRSGRWKPGQSGNPSGKPPGSGELQKLRAAIGEHVPAIIEQLVKAARGGDVQAARLILERVLPPIKAVEQSQATFLPEGTLTDQRHAILAAVASGDLAPEQAAQILTALGALRTIVERDELAECIAAMEGD